MSVGRHPMLSMLLDDSEDRLAARAATAARVEQFYNKNHQQSGEDGGQFVEGKDGPGRKRDAGKEDLGKSGVNDPALGGKKVAEDKGEAKKEAAAEDDGLTDEQRKRIKEAEWADKEYEEGILSDKAYREILESGLEDRFSPTAAEKAYWQKKLDAFDAKTGGKSKSDSTMEDASESEPSSPSSSVLLTDDMNQDQRDDAETRLREKTGHSDPTSDELDRFLTREAKGEFDGDGATSITNENMVDEFDDFSSTRRLAQLPDNERAAVEDYRMEAGGYSSDETDRFNAALRDGGEASDVVKSLDSAIAKYTAEEDLTTYRGVKGDFAAKLAGLPVGSSYTDEGYTSVAGDDRAAAKFDQKDDSVVVQTFIVPKGSNAFPLGGAEAELIVGRGSTWVKTDENEWTLKEAA